MFHNFMQPALIMAEKALLADEVPVGAVIVNPQTNEIIASSYNLVEKKQDPTAHAEMLVIQLACQKLANKNLTNLDIYVTLQPCTMCMQAIIYAKVKRIYFGAYDQETPINIAYANHKPEIYGGIEEEKCKNLLSKFFTCKRA
jgi:tRNA(adenine34) deaminase